MTNSKGPLQHIEAQDPRYFVLRQAVMAAWTGWALLAVVGWLLADDAGLVIALIMGGGGLLALLLRLYHKSQVEAFQHYRQLEALHALYATLKPHLPLPPMRLWAISPDFATLQVGLIAEHKPKLIVELGSGVSTLISCYALRTFSIEGRVIALDHDADYAGRTRDLLRTHGLDGLATVIHAPIAPETRWYDLAAFPEDLSIDLLVVDGPPQAVGPMARYPALPNLWAHLAPGALILVDDTMRSDEQQMVARWLAEFHLDIIVSVANEKGAAILRTPNQKPVA